MAAGAVPLLAPAPRKPPPEAEKPKARGLRLSPPIGIALAVSAACGAFVIYGALQNSTFASAKTQATAGFAAAVGALETPLEAITGAKEREEERADLHDLGAALAQVTVRLDQIEHEYGARLDKLSERIDEASSSRFADIAARLDKLEQKTAAPAAPASQLADVTTRLDKLEKSACPCGCVRLAICRLRDEARQAGEESRCPATPSPDGRAARLDKGEKKARVPPQVRPRRFRPQRRNNRRLWRERSLPPRPRRPDRTARSLCSETIASRMYGSALR